MECMLLPKEPITSLVKVPHIDDARYDGKDWFSYPERRIKNWPKMGSTNAPDLHKYMNYLEEIKEIEPMLQTWLFFGLLSEFFRGNALETTNEVVCFVYKKYTYNDAGSAYLTTSTLLRDMEEATLKNLSDRVLFKESCLRLKDRIYATWVVLKATPADFDQRVRASIGAVAEILAYSMNLAFSLYKLPTSCPTSWTENYLSEQSSRDDGIPTIKETMITNGWCPSDISRAINNFNSLQILHFLGKMSRSLPPRDHSKCDEIHCTAYQITQDYKVRHVKEKCGCQLVHVRNSEIIRILNEGESIPLLRFVGDVENLEIEIVQSTKETPYVAISHVWADGLGNQKANALNSCELIRLRKLVEGLGNQDATLKDPFLKQSNGVAKLVWIDTLCCPVGPGEAKKMSLKKLRNVYQNAAQVLVLDGSLEAYSAEKMSLTEQLARIFTSGWLRRLWTLQEGALAESLYFQFADTAISLDRKKVEFFQSDRDIRKRIIMLEFLAEYRQIQSFYHHDRLSNDPGFVSHIPNLSVVNSSLQYRSVSISTDEPLCIACLLSISTAKMLEEDVLESDRMKILWTLIAERDRGLPASIIFLEDTHIDEPGWRWAPSTLLTAKPQFHPFDTRILLWADKNLGQSTPNGLKVGLPGYRFIHEHQKNKQPWSGVKRISETNVFFRDVESLKWYLIFDTDYYMRSKSWTKEEREEHNKQKKYPLNDLVSQVPSYIIRDSSGNLGVLASAVPANEIAAMNEPLAGIPVRTRFHVVCVEASPAQTTLMNAIELLARELRSHKLTTQLLALDLKGEDNDSTMTTTTTSTTPEATNEEQQQRAATLKDLEDEMKRMMREAIDQQPDLGPAIDSVWSREWRDLVWVCIGDWYYNDFKAARMPDEQIWYVD